MEIPRIWRRKLCIQFTIFPFVLKKHPNGIRVATDGADNNGRVLTTVDEENELPFNLSELNIGYIMLHDNILSLRRKWSMLK